MKSGAAVLALLLCGSPLLGDQTGAAFLKITPSVRSQSLAGNQALLVGPEAIGANPAGLALQSAPWGGYAAYSAMESDLAHGQLAAVRRFSQSRRALGISLTTLKADGGSATDATGAPASESTGSQDFALSMGLGGPIAPQWFWGAAGRAIQSTVGNASSKIAWAGDAGLLWRSPAVSAGVSLNNFGTPIRYGHQADPLPSSFRIDGAWKVGDVTFVAQRHASLKEKRTLWGAGLEYGIGPLTLRGAATAVKSGAPSSLAGTDFLERMTFGLGFRAGPTQWDYAFSELEGDQGTWHRLALSWRWGEPKGKTGALPTRVEGDRFGEPLPKKIPRVRTKKSPTQTPPSPTSKTPLPRPTLGK